MSTSYDHRYDKTAIHTWNLPKGAHLRTIQLSGFRHVLGSSHHRLVVASQARKDVVIFNAKSELEVTIPSQTLSESFTPDGRSLVVSGCRGDSVKIWYLGPMLKGQDQKRPSGRKYLSKPKKGELHSFPVCPIFILFHLTNPLVSRHIRSSMKLRRYQYRQTRD